MAASLTKPDAGRPLLAFDFADHKRVVIALVRGDGPGHVTAWVIEDGRPGDHASRWPREARQAVLAEAVVDRIDAITAMPADG